MISIITAYYNRKSLFLATLRSIARTKYKDFEVIAVDDASREEERLEDLLPEFPFLRILRVEEGSKWYANSCIPYNMGIAKAIGNIIILQNPECLHTQDILSYATRKINESNYFSVSTYSINAQQTKEELLLIDSLSFLQSLPQQHVDGYIGWYNHSIYNPVHYHFCSIITRSNMNKLGGFDERYAAGIGYEDNEFIDRIGRLGLNKIICDDISVIHQWHPKVYDLSISPYYLALFQLNGNIHLKTQNENIIHVKNSYI